MNKTLVIGAGGQIGRELVEELCRIYGSDTIIASDVKDGQQDNYAQGFPCLYEQLDVMDAPSLAAIVKRHDVKEAYLLAALLSATAEKYPQEGWKLNMDGLLNVLELTREKIISKLYWPSSIAAFGPNTPKVNTPQYTIMEPSTVYGISKQAGERWCEYYHRRYGTDVRSLRYPGLISYKSLPGGGTTDYAIHIFYEALKLNKVPPNPQKGAMGVHPYECFLSEDSTLPMMYMPDAIRATIEIMQADASKVKIRSSYNLAAISFSPAEIAQEIKKHIPAFEIVYKPDMRQAIADSWPQSIDDSFARKDWGWKHEYNLESMTKDMLEHLINN